MAKEFDINSLPLPLVHRDFTFTAKDIIEDKKSDYHKKLRKLTVEEYARRAGISMSREEQDCLEPNEEEIAMANEQLTFSEIQAQIREWADRNFKDNTSKRDGRVLNEIGPFYGIVEELGELAHAELKSHQGIRGFDDVAKYVEARDDALSDILVYMCDFAGRLNPPVDLQKVLNQVWAKVKQRDWEKNKVNAADVVEAAFDEKNKQHQSPV